MSAGSATRGGNTACILLQLLRQPDENAVVACSQERGWVVLPYAMVAAMPAASAGRE